jgi:pimeloyl-ACP methyl ester carboxylesterase
MVIKKNLIAVSILIFYLSMGNMFAQSPDSIPMHGRLVDAGGHLLHMNIMGHGKPIVVLENGSADFSFIWSFVQPEVAKFTTVVSYDRAGYAWSEPGPTPRTGHQIVSELHRALVNAGLQGPYILVGQSFGGFLVRAFARYYPKEVTGMVLVEALNENSRISIGDKIVRIREMATGKTEPAVQDNFKPSLEHSSGKIQIDTSLEFPMNKLPDSIQRWQIWAQSQPNYRKAVESEMTWSPEDVSNLYMHKGTSSYMLGDIPLIVLTRGSGGYNGRVDSAELEKERLSLQLELSHLSSNGKNFIDKNSGHNIHIEDPAVVIDAIRQVFNAAKFHRHL